MLISPEAASWSTRTGKDSVTQMSQIVNAGVAIPLAMTLSAMIV
jgi:hypothetical protein